MNDDPNRPDPGRARAAIDAGKTGDKVPAEDPAAAPMHTDAEAAGTPTPSAAAEADVARQERIARETGAADVRPIAAGADTQARRASKVRIPVTAVLVVASALLIGMLLGLA